MEVVVGKIILIEQAALTVMSDEDKELKVDLSLCSRAYKLNQKLGDRIILKTAIHEHITYILDALIYRNETSP